MTRSIWLDGDRLRGAGKDKSPAKFDVVIVGAGITGASLAYLLSRDRKDLKVALVDSGTVASAATGRGAGMVMRGIQTHYNQCVRRYGRENANFIYRFAEENQSMILSFVEETGVDVGLEKEGSYTLAASIEELEELEESAELLGEDGFSVEYLKDDPIERDFYGALYTARDFGINPVALTRALVEAADVQLMENEHVLRLERKGDGLAVDCVGQTLECQKVFLAANAYGALMDRWLGGVVHASRGQMLVTQPLDKRVVRGVCSANYSWVYFRQLADGRFMLGGRRQLFAEEEVGYADLVTLNVQSALEDYLKDSFPDVVGASIDYRFSGTMAFTRDGLPVVGEHPDIAGVYYAMAFNGHGFGYAMRIASHLIQVALDGNSPGVFDGRRASLAVPDENEGEEDEGP